MSVYIAKINTPRGPISSIHCALYACLPPRPEGSKRPFVWRVADGGRSIVFVSSEMPIVPHATISLEAGRSYEFAITYTRDKHVGKKKARHLVEINSMLDLRDRISHFAGSYGGSVGFVRHEHMRTLHVRRQNEHLEMPIVDAYGRVVVEDPVAFEQVVLQGGPGGAKVYGCGMWWLPEIMEPALSPAKLERIAA
ncbi:type I-E CRISPR-associated protein Cas6/Cse3/CasE [Methylosinus sp. PW1]|uniref:type I-E CRISPR-associated protein Cas6/Cse3/CasE n=1 Tax=Methylosinus sp. PW1 TaxID=107636 RepID=UPI000569D474|nr:type I-E CRISPR-associated protein Cas6/Cse3/CasE [Methylosinus sp. PW1]